MIDERFSHSNENAKLDIPAQKSLMTVKEFQQLVPINVRWAIQKHDMRLVEEGAIIRYGRKILIDPKLFVRWLRRS